jgi:hypothetical protein
LLRVPDLDQVGDASGRAWGTIVKFWKTNEKRINAALTKAGIQEASGRLEPFPLRRGVGCDLENGFELQ